MAEHPMRAAHAAHPDWQVAVDACLASLDAGDAADLGFVYATDAFAPHLADIEIRLRDATGIPHWVGSVGLGICASGIEYFDEPALCVLVARFPPQAFRVFSGIVEGLQAFEAANGDWCDRRGARFAMVHADPHNARIDGLVQALCARMDGGYLVGGLTSSRGAHAQIADGITSGGLSGVLFDPEITVVTRLTQGCTPIGPRRTVTRSRGNVLHELDGRPALDVFYADIGEALAGDPARLGARVFAGLPVKGSDTGDYLVRNLAGIDEESRALAIAEWVQEGDQLMFCRRDAEAAGQDMARMLAEIQAAIDAPPRGGVYYTCLARGPNLFGANSEELKRIENALGDFPLVGFFGNGEIAHDRLYGYTGVLTLFV
jgi:small ligand-binding sensory domain FIST